MFETTRETFIERLARHEGEAWHVFATNYSPLIRSFCRRTGLQDADVDDVMQTVCQSLSKSLSNFEYDRDRGRFRDYLGRVATNAARRFLGRRQKRREMRLDTSFSDAIPQENAMEETWLDEWRNYHCRVALRTLRRQLEAKSLDVFEYLLEGKSVEEACAQYSLDREAVYKIRMRVRNRLKEQIRKQMVREDEFFQWA